MNHFHRVCMMAAGIALAAGPVASADGGGEERRGPPGGGRHELARDEHARRGSGPVEEHRQGRYQGQHENRGGKDRRAHRFAPKRQWRHKMMGRILRWIVPRLSPGQRGQVRKIRLEMRRQLNTSRARLKNFRLDLRETLRQFPLDRDAMKAIFGQMAKERWKLFSLRLSALAQIQNLAGKKLWEQAQEEARSGARGKSGAHPAPDPGAGHGRR